MICVLEENRKCNNCGECDMCDLDVEKRCNNCCTCIDNPRDDMRTIIVRKEDIVVDAPRLKRNIYRWK